jgi:hypothetical protein
MYLCQRLSREDLYSTSDRHVTAIAIVGDDSHFNKPHLVDPLTVVGEKDAMIICACLQCDNL